jgi:hypothetical protein
MNKEKYLHLCKEKSCKLITEACDFYSNNNIQEATMYMQELDEVLRDLKESFRDEI